MSVLPENLGPLEDLVGYHFRRTSSMIRKDFDSAVDGLGIRQVSFAVLSVISANPGIRQGEVGTLLDIQRANMVTMIGDLSEAGLVERGRDSGDRRAVTLSLTKQGEDMLAQCIARIREHEDNMLKGLTKAEIGKLISVLAKIRRNCEAG